MSDSAIAQRLDDFREQRRIQAGSLIISVFGDVILPRGGRIWLGSLIRILEPLGLSERLVRTSVFRLVKDEWLGTETHGRRADYFVTPMGRRRFEEAARHIYASRAPQWDQRWRLILVVGDLDAKARERLRRALFWQGFGALKSEIYLHPGADLASVGDALLADGLSDVMGSLLPLFAADYRTALAASDADLVRRAWDLGELGEAYAHFVATYQPILDELRGEQGTAIDGEDALLARILLIHDYRRLSLRDPQLPEVLLPADWPGQQARLVCQEIYKRLEHASSAQVDALLRLADDSSPAEDSSVPQRFLQADPLGDELVMAHAHA